MTRVALAALAAVQTVVGGWALLAPRAFFDGFPAAGHAWVALLPPYNEHLVRDVGALSLGLAFLLAAAAVAPRPDLVRVALGAQLVTAVPHAVFHALHLDGFAAADAAAQMTGFALQVAVPAWLLLAPSLAAHAAVRSGPV